ncbi:MAG: hypothetical protein U0231_03615 [Nitrospiraceae bacterium]
MPFPFESADACHLANFGETEPLALDAYQSRGGLAGPIGPAHVSGGHRRGVEGLRVARARRSGIPGVEQVAGRATDGSKFVVANADEGDAGTYCDRMIMEGEPFRLLEGMLICARAIGATQGLRVLPSGSIRLPWQLRAAIQKFDEAELLK